MRRLALATIAAIGLTTGTAHAAFAPADSYPQLGRVLPIARAAWPDSPCRDREMISIEPAPLIAPDGVHSLGVAWRGTCNLQLEDSLLAQPELMCWVVTHEFGHLSGIWEHSTDPTSIMAPNGQYPPCHVLVAPQLITPVAQTPTAEPTARHRTKAKCRQHNPKKRRACKRAHR